ncbi:MAG TPA: 30S ribosomal protein S6 [Candidatus Sulfotelmatobacter sp.]|nr:30S ribosomal protein S6 [Candidatus Sulfotelmatobacter sp.]
MAFYENVFIARQDISSQQAETLATEFSEIVKNNGGTVTKTEHWGLRNLSFRIKKNRKGHYVLLNLDAPPAAVAELERNMRINEDVLRYLTVRVEELEAGPSAVLQSRSRDERPRRDGERGGRFGDRDRGERGGRFGDRGPREDRAPREARNPEGAE